MEGISILQNGTIYFFFRPKIEASEKSSFKEEAQRFMMVLNPESSNNYIMVVVGKKELPEGSGESYFAFVEKVCRSLDELVEDLKSKYYSTKTKGKRKLCAAHFLGQGRYLIVNYKQHTDILYKLSSPSRIKSPQRSFNIKPNDQFIIQVKNTISYPSSTGELGNKIRLGLPDNLKEILANHKFIPLMPADFIFYEGVEILLNSRGKQTLQELEPKIKEYLSEAISNDLIPFLESIDNTFTVSLQDH